MCDNFPRIGFYVSITIYIMGEVEIAIVIFESLMSYLMSYFSTDLTIVIVISMETARQKHKS